MLKNKGGFTLIELVMIIVILGILAAVAIPRYIDMQSQARRAVVQGAYGGVGGQLQITLANFRRYPDGLNFETSVMRTISRDGWTYVANAAASEYNATFNIYSGTAAPTTADPFIQMIYNTTGGSNPTTATISSTNVN